MIRVEVPRPANVKNMKAEDLYQESRGEELMYVFTDAVDAMRAYEPNEYKPLMTANEYQNLAMRTCSIPYENKREMLLHATTGLASEAGEFAGLLQKVYQGHEYDRDHALKELGDCCWMISEACVALNTTLEEVMRMNIEKLKTRYPEGFDPEKSLHRKEGDV